MTTQILRETLDLSESQMDNDARMLRGVVLIRAGTSLNRRKYSEGVLQDATPLFEGVKAYANHGDPRDRNTRSMRDVTGWYQNVRYTEGKLIADRYFTKNQAGLDAMAIAEDIVSGRAPKSLAGLSINAIGEGQTVKASDGDVLEVSRISRAVSVDDVSDAAAGGGYTEGETFDLTASLLEALTFDEWFKSRPDYIKRVQNEMKTVRQDDALKAAQADAEAAREALTEVQTQLTAAQTEREAAVLEAQTARRELAIERLLDKANVPDTWLTSLREQLMKADENNYAAIIEAEETKAKAAGHRVTVTGAGAQVQPRLIVEAAPKAPKPIDMNRIETPEELAALMRQTRITQ
jgi:hypothetical protein